MTPYLILLPVLLLFLTALGIVILQQARPSVGYAWLIGSLGALVTAAVVTGMRWYLPLGIEVNAVSAFPGFSSPPSFSLDRYSWPYVFSMAVLALGFLLTDSARLETEARPLNWAAGLGLVGICILTLMSANPITLVLTWTAVDLAELMMVLMQGAGRRAGEQMVIAFSVRVSGTVLILTAVLVARSQGIDFQLLQIPSSLGIYMLLAAGLRLGVLPLNIPYFRDVYPWRGLGNVLRMIGPASSLVLLGRMPSDLPIADWRVLLLGLSGLAAVYGAAMFLNAKDEISGRPYWFAALAGLAVASVINGSPQASIAWGTALILFGSVLFFFSARRRQILYIPALGVIGISGLPFTPAASGWQGVIGGSAGMFSLFAIITVVLLIWGYLRHAWRGRDELYRMERWVHTIYPTGLLIMIAAGAANGYLGWPGSRTVGIWWASITAALIAGGGIVLALSLRSRFDDQEISGRWLSVFARRIGGVLAAIFRLNWLYRFLAWLYGIVQSFIQLLTAMFEGDGGILWALVILALLISQIIAGGA